MQLKLTVFAITALAGLAGIPAANADLLPGVISDFQDGTTQGWGGGSVVNVADSGPGGVGDNSLQLSNGGIGGNFSMRNLSVAGVIAPGVVQINTDMFRPAGQSNAEIRLVLHDISGNRWATTASQIVTGNGTWATYSFSIREPDLTLVLGAGTYSELRNGLNRIMFRHDPGAPDAGGVPLAGTVNFDNITAIPEPGGAAVAALALLAFGRQRRRR